MLIYSNHFFLFTYSKADKNSHFKQLFKDGNAFNRKSLSNWTILIYNTSIILKKKKI